MINDRERISDGFTTLQGGMDSGKSPALLKPTECSYSENVSFRGGFAKTRPAFKKLTITGDVGDNTSTPVTKGFLNQKFQGSHWFTTDQDEGYIIAVAGGMIYKIEPPLVEGASWVCTDITNGITLRSRPERVWMVQAKENSLKNYLIIQDGVSVPVIYDPIGGVRRSDTDNNEVPMGSGPMAYGHGRLWVAQGSNFVAGDIANGATGVLKFTENEYIIGGGAFRVPLGSGDVTAMKFTHAPNTSIGQGELVVFTQNGAVSITVPADRYDWFATADPAQRVVLINNGSMSQFSTDLANGDILFRAKDGIRSLISAIRDFSQYGNTPISREVNRVLSLDDPKFFKYTSGVLFDNRYLLTTNTRQDQDKGVGFKGLVVLDFDLISGMGESSKPAYDGYWQLDVTRTLSGASTKVNIEWMQLVTGMVDSVEHCICFGRQQSTRVGTTDHDTGDTEMWSLQRGDSKQIADEDGTTENSITSEVETASYNFGVPGGAKKLETADLWVDNVTGGVVSFSSYFHPDQYPAWISWQDWSINAAYKDCHNDSTNTACLDVNTYLPQYRPRMSIGEPPAGVVDSVGSTYNYGFEFAARIKWTGRARLKMLRLNARNVPEVPYADVDAIDSTEKTETAICEDGQLKIPEI